MRGPFDILIPNVDRACFKVEGQAVGKIKRARFLIVICNGRDRPLERQSSSAFVTYGWRLCRHSDLLRAITTDFDDRKAVLLEIQALCVNISGIGALTAPLPHAVDGTGINGLTRAR